MADVKVNLALIQNNSRRHICWHSTSFVYISKVYLHHVTARGKVIRHICLHSTSFAYISEAKGRFIYTTWPPGARSAAIFVHIWRHEVIDPTAIFVYITWPVTSEGPIPQCSLLILLNTLFSNILTLRSSLSVNNQVSHPYKTTGKIIFMYFLIFK